jgi:hypothetical protein
MSKESPQPAAYNVDMFSGQLRDTRTDKQKKDDFARQFNQPLMPITDKTRLGLVMFDARTDEEKKRDLERAAQRLT